MHDNIATAAAPGIGAVFEREAALGTDDAGGVALESKAAKRDGFVEELQSLVGTGAAAIFDRALARRLMVKPKPTEYGKYE